MTISRGDAEFSRAKLSVEALLDNGKIYSFRNEVNIANGSSHTVSFTTNNAPALLNLMTVDVKGTRDIVIQGFVGGTVTGGTPVANVFPRNHANPGDSPFAAGEVHFGRTVSVAGTLFFDVQQGQQDRSAASQAEGAGVILAPNVLYYLTISNNDQTADTVLTIIASNLG